MRHGSRALAQMIGSISQRSNGFLPSLYLGTIVSYDMATHMAVAQIDFGAGLTYQTPPSQLMIPWHGPGFSDASGPPLNVQCIVGLIDLSGDVFVILGFTATDDASGINVPSGEKKVLDPRGSFVHHAAQRGGMLRNFGQAIASIFGGTATEVGGENLDATMDAISTKRYIDDALTRQLAQLKSDLTTWATASLQPGHGAPGPPELMAIESNASSMARAVP